MDDLLDFFLPFFGGVVALIVVCVLVFFGLAGVYAATIGPAACSAFGQGMGLKTEYLFWYGCFVTTPAGDVIPSDIYAKNLTQSYKVQVK